MFRRIYVLFIFYLNSCVGHNEHWPTISWKINNNSFLTFKMQGNIFILIVGLVFIPSTKASSECDLCVDLVEAIEGFILAGVFLNYNSSRKYLSLFSNKLKIKKTKNCIYKYWPIFISYQGWIEHHSVPWWINKK